MISLDQYVSKCGNFVWRTYDDEGIIMTEDGMEIHMLNEVGAFIWTLVDGETMVDDIVTQICMKFDIQRDTAQEDAIEFIQKLIDKNLLQLSSNS